MWKSSPPTDIMTTNRLHIRTFVSINNATGCSSIYGGSAPATPYCKNYHSGFGPAWANSLFEDNAEFGLGMATATRQMRDRVERIMKEGLACDCSSDEIKALFTEWIANRENTLKTKEIADKLIPLMEKCGCDICKQLLGSAGAAVGVMIPAL